MEPTAGTSERLGAVSFDEVFRTHRSHVVHTAYLIVGSLPVAEEIAQEAFIRLLAHVDDVENPSGFLRTAVVRLCLTWRDRAAMERSRLERVDVPRFPSWAAR